MASERRRGTFAITTCSANDVPEIAALDRSMWGASANPRTLYRQLIDIFPRMVLVASDSNGRLAGSSVMLFNGGTRHGWIPSVDLHQDFRGQGLGRSLVSAMLDDKTALWEVAVDLEGMATASGQRREGSSGSAIELASVLSGASIDRTAL